MCAILFVSADMSTRQRWERLLSSRGCDVVAVSPQDEAAGTARPNDAIVVHVDRACDWRRALDVVGRSGEAPLIALGPCPSPDGGYRRLAFRLGFHAYVPEPCTVEQLLTAIDRLASGEVQFEVAAC